MTRRKWIILGAVILALTIGAELVVRPWSSSKGRVQVVNGGDSPMDDLILSYGESTVRLGTLKAGESTTAWFTVAGKGTLNLEFNQKGNPMQGLQIQEFDPEENLNNNMKLVLLVKANRVERFVEDDESTSPWKSLKESFTGWFEPDIRPLR